MTPQERWWKFRARLPRLTRWQQLGVAISGGVILLAFVIFILPFILPLQGETTAADQLADPNGQFIEIDGTQLYFVHDPMPESEVVILVHGFGGATVTWREVMPGLQAAGYDVYALDLPGAGLSEKGLEVDLSHAAQVQLLAHFMDAQQIQKAHLVGHSLGANLIVYLAQTYPERVASLTLVDASVQTAPAAGVSADLINLPFVKRWSQVILRWMIPDTIEIQLKSAVENDEVVNQALIDDYLCALKTEDWELSYLALARDSYRNTLPHSLSTLDVPTLILWGEKDSWIAPVNGENLAADIPGAELILLDGVGHLPMHENPAEFNRLMIEFLQENPIS